MLALKALMGWLWVAVIVAGLAAGVASAMQPETRTVTVAVEGSCAALSGATAEVSDGDEVLGSARFTSVSGEGRDCHGYADVLGVPELPEYHVSVPGLVSRTVPASALYGAPVN